MLDEYVEWFKAHTAGNNATLDKAQASAQRACNTAKDAEVLKTAQEKLSQAATVVPHAHLEDLAAASDDADAAAASSSSTPAPPATINTASLSLARCAPKGFNPWFSTDDGSWQEPPQELLDQSRRFCISPGPRLCMGRGDLVEVLVRCGLGHYLEFKAMDGAYVYLPPANSRKAKRSSSKSKSKPSASAATSAGAGVSAGGGGGAGGGAGAGAAVSAGVEAGEVAPYPHPSIAKVPCAKKDVFLSGFSLLEKRYLMKFLQFCVDMHSARVGAEVEERNELLLGKGRSLTR